MIRFNCQQCGRAFTARDHDAGRHARCKACGADVTVPAASAAPTRVPADAAVPAGTAAFAGAAALAEPAELPPAADAPRRVPMRLRRLTADAEQMRAAFAGVSSIRVVAADGDPPELYRLEYNVRGLERGKWPDKPVPRRTHLVEIQLTSEYPRQSPLCRMRTPVFHPNIDPAKGTVASFRKPATEKAIADFEAKAKLELPEGVRALYLLHDGQEEDAANEESDEPISPGLFPSLESDDLAFLLVPLKQLKGNTPTTRRASRMPGYRLNWAGIGDNYGGDHIVVDLNTDDPKERGRVLQFNHEYGCAAELAPSIEAYLTMLADDLDAGRVVFDERGGLSYAEGHDWDDLIDEGKAEFDPEMEEA